MSDLKSSMEFIYKIKIRERFLDFFGHMNNSSYLVLFEEARWEMITSRGYGVDEIKKSGIGSVVLDCRIRFKKEITNRENISIHIKVAKFDGKILVLEQSMVNELGDVCASSEFTIGCFDLKNRKLIKPPEAWRLALGLDAAL